MLSFFTTTPARLVQGFLPAFFCLLFLAVFPGLALADNTVSGTVYLPPGHLAPPGGLDVRVNIVHQNSSYTQSAVINEGMASAGYNIVVPEVTDIEWEVSYYLVNDIPGYVSAGYYNLSATTRYADQATLLAGGNDHSFIDLTLITCNFIRGAVSLPEGHDAPPGSRSISVFAYNTNGGELISTSVEIDPGQTAVAYHIQLSEVPHAAWRVEYFSYGDTYLSRGYYNASGTTADRDQATLLAGGIDHESINLTLLFEGNTIRGTLSLPEGSFAPAGGIFVNIFASSAAGNNDGSWIAGSSLFIAEDGTSTSYTIALPPSDGDTTPLIVRYSINQIQSTYITPGYYSAAGTTWDRAQASALAAGIDHDSIDLTLISEGNSIKGTVSLPAGFVAPQGGMYVNVQVSNTENYSMYARTPVFIEEGSSLADYSINVQEDNTALWRVSYSYYGNPRYIGTGYYTATGTTRFPEQATLLPGGVNYPTINFTLLIAGYIGGTVSLPSGHKLITDGDSEGDYLAVRVFAEDQQGNWYGPGTAYYTPGISTDEYIFSVPREADLLFTVFYDALDYDGILVPNVGYVVPGYYSEVGTTASREMATPLAGGTDHAAINLKLVPRFSWNRVLPAIIFNAKAQAR